MNQTKTKAPIFSKDISLSIKGIAILMMIAHHCFAFPDYWLDHFTVLPVVSSLSSSFKICVAVFAFITGYGFYHSSNRTYKDVLRKALNFMIQYWFQLFVIFLPIACIHSRFSGKKILLNMFALYDNIILFAWYVFFHLLVLLTFPLVKKILNDHPVQNLLIVLAG